MLNTRSQAVQTALLSPARIRLYGLALFVIGLPLFPATLRFVTTPGKGSDWSDFWTAASTVGTRALLNPEAHAVWTHAHGLPIAPFVYLPAAAWLLWPASNISLGASFVAHAFLMLVLCLLCGLVAAKTYRLDLQSAVLGVLAWAPATAAIVTGQNSPLGLLLALLAIFGLTRNRFMLTGLAVGMLLYKPTYALPLIVVLLVFRRWSALAITCASAGVWYLLSVAATGGDWAWPATYMHVLASYVGTDFAGNAAKAISLPGVLLRFGIPAQAAYAAGIALLLASSLLLARVSLLEAASISCLVGLAASAHAWEYDAVLALPAIFYAIKYAPDPWRTRAVCTAYAIVPLWQYASYIRFDTVAVVVLGGTIAWALLTAARHTSRAAKLRGQVHDSPLRLAAREGDNAVA